MANGDFLTGLLQGAQEREQDLEEEEDELVPTAKDFLALEGGRRQHHSSSQTKTLQ